MRRRSTTPTVLPADSDLELPVAHEGTQPSVRPFLDGAAMTCDEAWPDATPREGAAKLTREEVRAHAAAGMATPSDRDLLEAWRADDKVAGEKLVDRYYEELYRFFRNKRIDDHKDLVHETFVACLAGRDRLRHDDRFRSYLFGIACNVWRMHLRRRYRLGAEHLDVASVADLSPGPEQLLAQTRQERVLLRALRSLPVERQILLELRFCSELPSAEIAEVLDVPDNTVRSRLARAVSELRTRVTELAGQDAELASTVDNLEEWARRCRVALVQAPWGDDGSTQ